MLAYIRYLLSMMQYILLTIGKAREDLTGISIPNLSLLLFVVVIVIIVCFCFSSFANYNSHNKHCI